MRKWESDVAACEITGDGVNMQTEVGAERRREGY